MTKRTVPHESADESARNQQAYAFLDVGVVTSAPTQTDDGSHHVSVAETRVPADTPIPVIPSAHGDFYVPPEGTPVLVAYTGKNEAVVIGSPVPQTTTPNVEAGERIVSHPLNESSVHFQPNGDVEVVGANSSSVVVKANGNVVINGSSTGAVTDVTIDGTNSEGGATSLNVARSSSVFL